MGDKNVKAAVAASVRLGLSRPATLLLIVAARFIHDPERGNLMTWHAPRSDTAALVGISERAADRAWAELVAHGLAQRTIAGAPGKAANYRMHFGIDDLSERWENVRQERRTSDGNVRQERRTKGANLAHERGESGAPNSPMELPDAGTRGGARESEPVTTVVVQAQPSPSVPMSTEYDEEPPSRYCPKHRDVHAEGACGACADARSDREDWERRHPRLMRNGKPGPDERLRQALALGAQLQAQRDASERQQQTASPAWALGMLKTVDAA